MNIYTILEQRNVTLPNPPAPGANYAVIKQSNNQVYISGQTPKVDGVLVEKGKVGDIVTPEDGYQLARLCTLNAISALNSYTGDLNNVAKIVKITVFVSSDPSFFEQAQVANGATDLLIEIFGKDIGFPARSAVGMAVLPGDAPCEVEMIVELRNA